MVADRDPTSEKNRIQIRPLKKADPTLEKEIGPGSESIKITLIFQKLLSVIVIITLFG